MPTKTKPQSGTFWTRLADLDETPVVVRWNANGVWVHRQSNDEDITKSLLIEDTERIAFDVGDGRSE